MNQAWSDVPDADLVAHAKRGEAKAFHELVERHADYVHAVAVGLVHRRQDAEDLVQETFLTGMQGISRFQGRSSVRTWLVSILMHQVSAWRRRMGVRQTGTLTQETDSQVARASPDAAAEAAMQADIAAAVEQLPVEFKEALVLREYGGLSYEEIAATLKVPRGTVESRLHRARMQLRALLAAYGPE